MDQFAILNKSQSALETQQIIEEQRRQQALLLLQQPQQLLEKTLPQGNPLNDMGPHGTGRFTNSVMYGSNPLDIECRNILALQEELKRQEIKRNAEEIINRKVREQAFLMELQKQAEIQQQQQQQQQHSANNLLERFTEIDQLVARQELFNRLGQEQQRSALTLDHLHAVGLHGHTNPSIHGHGPGGMDGLGAIGNNHAIHQTLIDALRSQGNLDSMHLQGLHQRLQSPLGHPTSVLSNTSEISRVLSNVPSFRDNHSGITGAIPKDLQTLQSLQSLSVLSQQNNDFMDPTPQQGEGGSLLLHSNYLPTNTISGRLSCHSAHSNDDIQYGNMSNNRTSNGVPGIRYFNNGAEITRDGRTLPTSSGSGNASHNGGKKRRITEQEVISLDDDETSHKGSKKIKSEPRSSESVNDVIETKVKNEKDVKVKIKVKTESSPRSSSVRSSSVSMMNRCSLPKKNTRKLSEICSPASRRLDIPEAPTKSQQKRKKRPMSQDDREEEKVDAANVLLGLMKNA